MLGTALRLVFTRRGYVLGAVLATLLTATLYAYAGQIVTIFAGGTIFVDADPTRLAALAVLSLLMGLVLPVQVYAVRRAAWRFRQGGTGLLGFIAGLGSLTCCSPLLLPALLSLAGFSGSALLSLNVTLYRYFEPLAALSAVLLALSLVLAARDITRACTFAPVQNRNGRAAPGAPHHQEQRTPAPAVNENRQASHDSPRSMSHRDVRRGEEP